MAKAIEGKYNKLIKSTDPKKQAESFLEYMKEAMDVFFDENPDVEALNEADEKFGIGCKFFMDNCRVYPNVYLRAGMEMNVIFMERCINRLNEERESKLFFELNYHGLVMNLRDIIEISIKNLDLYAKTGDQKYLKTILFHLNEKKSVIDEIGLESELEAIEKILKIFKRLNVDDKVLENIKLGILKDEYVPDYSI